MVQVRVNGTLLGSCAQRSLQVVDEYLPPPYSPLLLRPVIIYQV